MMEITKEELKKYEETTGTAHQGVVCNECDDDVDECSECGNVIEYDDVIYCGSCVMGDDETKHICEECWKECFKDELKKVRITRKGEL